MAIIFFLYILFFFEFSITIILIVKLHCEVEMQVVSKGTSHPALFYTVPESKYTSRIDFI